jgi:hypothetical protein
MDKDLENRLLGIAVAKGEWYAAVEYLYKKLKYSVDTSWRLMEVARCKNPDLDIPLIIHRYEEHH